MITGELRHQVDRIWEAFWTGGISNPLTVIEQFTYLLFLRRLDERQQFAEKKAALLGTAVEKPLYSATQAPLRWRQFKDVDPEQMFKRFTQPHPDWDNTTAFELMKQQGDGAGVFAQHMKGATFMIPTPRLLDQVVQMIGAIAMDDRDTKGDLYEYLLSKIASAGTNGQFRTPRHIIKLMVEIMQPDREDRICDPACGTAGFLVAAAEYFHEHDPDAFHDADFKAHFNEQMFTGLEFDPTMLRIGAMNLQLHGIEQPQLISVDSLSEANSALRETHSLVLANPPFKGSLDFDAVEGSLLKTVKTKKTELLFIALILRQLDVGGRAAVIVPDGVLFGSSKAHKSLRRQLIEGQRLEAVISMPGGVFKPYAGVSTAILIFTKTDSGGTDTVWFYDMRADGYSLDDKRSPVDANDLPDILQRWHSLTEDESIEAARARTEQSFLVPVDEIAANDWDLSINRYKEVVYEEVEYDPPVVIIEQIETLDRERAEALAVLKRMLG